MEVLHAPAKLTTSLRIVGVRPDGMHLIDAEMVTLDLADRLEVAPGDGLEVVGGEAGAVADNLVTRALVLAGRRARVVLHKRIPAGAGLGGGSADAAAILRWAGVSDLDAAAGLGADVAFCLVGGRARVTGIGERVDPLPYTHRVFTLLTPPFGCATPTVYRRWDEMGGPAGHRGNDLEPAAIAAYPDLAAVGGRLGDATGRTPRLAGSGSTWFVEGAFDVAGGVVATTVPSGWDGAPAV